MCPITSNNHIKNARTFFTNPNGGQNFNLNPSVMSVFKYVFNKPGPEMIPSKRTFQRNSLNHAMFVPNFDSVPSQDFHYLLALHFCL